MGERKRTLEGDIREAFGDKVQIQLPPGVLSEGEIRAIVRDEMAMVLARTAANTWRHDAGHGSLQARRNAQRERDEAAGLAQPES